MMRKMGIVIVIKVIMMMIKVIMMMMMMMMMILPPLFHCPAAVCKVHNETANGQRGCPCTSEASIFGATCHTTCRQTPP